MKVESRLFEICTAFFFLCGIVYAVITPTPPKVESRSAWCGLFLTGGLSLIIGDLLPVRRRGGWRSARRTTRRRRSPTAPATSASSRRAATGRSASPRRAALVGISLAFFHIWLLVDRDGAAARRGRRAGLRVPHPPVRPLSLVAPPTRRAPFGARRVVVLRDGESGVGPCPPAMIAATGGEGGMVEKSQTVGVGAAPLSRIETNGINVIADAERKGRPASCSGRGSGRTSRCSRSATASFVLGFGISFWQAVIVGVLGIVASFLLCGFVRVAGQARLGADDGAVPGGVRGHRATSCPRDLVAADGRLGDRADDHWPRWPRPPCLAGSGSAAGR